MPLDSYRLIHQRGAGQDGAKYQGESADSQAVDVRVLHSELSESRRTEIRQRLRLCELLTHEAHLPILDYDLDGADPFVVLTATGDGEVLCEELRQQLDMTETLVLAQSMIQLVKDCHRVGMPYGSFFSDRMTRTNNAWHVDVSGLLCSAESSEKTFAPPDPDDTAGDVLAFGLWMHWLVFGKSVSPDHASQAGMVTMDESDPSRIALSDPVTKLIQQCLERDEDRRLPTQKVGETLSRLIEHASGQQTMSGNDLTMDQTVVCDPPDAESIALSRSTVPDQLGRYRVTDKLGEGGMGAVYRGEDMSDGREVAIKVLAGGVAGKPSMRRRFFKEARILAQVNNPFITNLLEFNEDQGENYIVLEFVAGRSLDGVLEEHGALSESAAIRILSDVSRALLDAHHRGIVHRDIKPGNVLLTSKEDLPAWLGSAKTESNDQPCAKLSDFGLARNEDQTESLAITQAGALIGTPHYMAPEQCRGESVDTRTDIYQMGATLFHLLAGHPPFRAETPIGLIAKHVSEPPPSLRKLKPDLSEAIVHIVEKALSKEPDARYTASADLLNDLESLALGNPTTLQLHPHLPSTNSDDVLTFEFEWEMKSSPGALWPHVVNTDRLNQAMGLPPAQFRTETDPQLGTRRFAETRIMGLKIAWEEHPFEWIEGRRMGVLRQFSHGPFKWFCSMVELQPRGDGGTRLRHIVHLEPRGMMGRWIGKREAGAKAKKSLTRIYHQIDDYEAAAQTSNPAADPFGQTARQSSRQQQDLATRMQRLRDRQLHQGALDVLEQFVAHASEQEVARIRPAAFAERFDLDTNDVLTVCFRAVQEGILVLLWDVLCPTCRIPSDVKETLATLGEHGNCEACNIDFELDFGNSVELIFRAHPEIRDVEVRTYCIGGPAFSAHVVAQVRVAPTERFVCELQLPAGAYRIRGPQLSYSLDFRVLPNGQLSRWELELANVGSVAAMPEPPTLKTGAQTLILRNESEHELLVRVERMASRQDSVTAADASAVALFRELFPDQVLSPGQMVSVETITMLMVELTAADQLYQELGDGAAFTQIHQALRFFDETIREDQGAVVKSVGEGITAVFHQGSDAVSAALKLVENSVDAFPAGSPLPRAAIHRGAAMVTTIDGRLDYFGSTVKITELLLQSARAGQVVLSGEIAATADISETIRSQSDRSLLVDREPLFLYKNIFPHRWT